MKNLPPYCIPLYYIQDFLCCCSCCLGDHLYTLYSTAVGSLGYTDCIAGTLLFLLLAGTLLFLHHLPILAGLWKQNNFLMMNF